MTTDLSRIKELRHVLLAATSHEDVLTRSMVVLDGYASLIERIEQLESALERIEAWEMPATGKFHECGTPMSCGWCFGSNGEREVIREIARRALKQENPT